MSWTAALADEAPLVFIHGLKGSELVTADGSVHWLTAWQALGLSTPDLTLPARFDNGVQPLGELHPGPVLDSVALVDVYGPFLDAAAQFGRPFYQFSYDWRRDNLETMAAFSTFLASVQARHGGARVDVVAHSMGGLVTLAVLNRQPELFAHVVFAGVPFGGGVGFLPDLQIGDETGLNKQLLAPAVVATFPSVFSFFPVAPTDKLLAAQDGSKIAADFFAPETWRHLALGPYGLASRPEGYDAFFAEVLGRAKRFRQLLVKADVPYPKILVVAGKTEPTLAAAVQANPVGSGWDFTSAAHAPGDGRVLFTEAMPPEGIPYELFESPSDHPDLLNDDAALARIRTFLGVAGR